MTRWIAFDEATATAVQSRTGGSVEMCSGDSHPAAVIALAAAAAGPAVAVVPASENEQALILRFTRIQRPTTERAPLPSAPRVAPGGFLGLADELVLEDEPAPPKKWWQKILD